MSQPALPDIAPTVVVADFDVELVVLVPERRRAHHLTPMWAVLFDSCRAGHSVERVVDDMSHASGWSEAEVRRWVIEATESFERSGIVVTPAGGIADGPTVSNAPG